MKIPVIVVSLVHIQGPLKGEIQELSKERIGIGRHPSNDVLFPKDLTIVSRNHAEIIREGNRFKLVDKSANGTFVNGKRVEETILKDGDVIEFAEGGPKVSFLTEMKEAEETAEEPRVIIPEPAPRPGPAAPPPVEPVRFAPEPQRAPEPTPQPPAPPPYVPPPEPPRSAPQMQEPQRPAQPAPPPVSQSVTPPRPSYEIPVQTVAASLVIQYGPAVRSYRELPVTIGHHPKCGFVLEQPGILDQHAQIFHAQGRYWVKDLTGQALVRVNNQVVDGQTLLQVNDLVSLGPGGPVFRYVGEGRLAEAEAQAPDSPGQTGLQPQAPGAGKTDAAGAPPQKGGLFSKMKKKKLF